MFAACPSPPLRIFALLAACLVLAACTPPEPVRIGFLGGLSGRVADLGIGGRNGATLAVELQNERGGIGGRPVELIVEDDQQDQELARHAVSRLLGRKVDVIVGPMTSAIAVAVLPQLNAAGVTLISPTATTNALTGIDDQFFRVVAPTAAHVAKSAHHHFERDRMRRVALVFDLRNRAYSEGWTEDFRKAFVALGGKVIAVIGFESSEATYFTSLAGQVLGGGPDGVVIVANSVDTALLIQKIRQRDAGVKLGTAEWAATERLIELGGKAVEGITVAQYVDRASVAPAYVDFRRLYLERFGQEPGFPGLTGFDAANVALAALAERRPGQTLKQAILARREFAGAQAAIRFDDFGDAQRDTYLSTVRDGGFQSH